MTAKPATNVNQMALNCPRGTSIKAVIKGAKACLVLPPTWKIDCASPRLSPAAK